MGVIGWILFGFVVGLIARAIMPGRDPIGVIGTTVLGIGGALIGGWIGESLGWYRADEGGGFLAATIGAIVVLAGYNFISRSRMKSRPLSGAKRSDKDDFGKAA